MKKESLGQYLLEKFKNYFEDWTDPEYGDNPDILELANAIYENTLDEVDKGWKEFLKSEEATLLINEALKRKEEGDHVGQTDSANGTKDL